MKKTAIFYGSTTGNTAAAAKKIATQLGIASTDVFNVDSTAPSRIADYDLLILGTSTWGSGDLQDDWEDFIAALEAMELADKQIALFGEGDTSMADTFCDGVGILYERLKPTNAMMIGEFNVDGLDFDESKAVRDGIAVGLLLDEMNHADLTDTRIASWAKLLQEEAK